MERLPLCIMIGPVEEAVLYENELIAGLTAFTLDTSDPMYPVITNFTCTNCFPRPSGNRIQDLAEANKQFPLRIYVGDKPDDTLVSFAGKAIGRLCNIHIYLSTTAKRVIRFTTYTPFPSALEVALLDLGVEIIVEPPDTDQPTRGPDAHL